MIGKRIRAAAARNAEGLLFIAPWLLGFCLFLAFPLAYSFYMSFHSVRILPSGPSVSYRGLDYYNEILFSSSALYNELIPFLLEALLMIPVILVFAFITAILLNLPFRGRALFRAVFFVPVIFSSGYVVAEFVNQGQGGFGFLERYDIAAMLASLFGDRAFTAALLAVLERFVLVLWYSGVQIIIFLAGRQTIPRSVYESARIDGASPWQVFWKITLPAMMPFIFLNLVYTVVDLFTFPFNPVIRLIDTGNYGYSSALAWIYFAMILAFLLLMFALFHRVLRAGYKVR